MKTFDARGWPEILVILFATIAGCYNGPSCEVEGRTFPVGVSWTCADGCNFCKCEAANLVASTLIGCSQPPGPAANKLTCEQGGQPHTHGTSWTCGHCQICTCTDGEISQKTMCSSDAGSLVEEQDAS
jgi:hypothetical protein